MKKKFLSIVLALFLLVPCAFSACVVEHGNGGDGDLGGGSVGGSITVTFMVDNNVYATRDVTEKGNVILPQAPQKDSKSFVGWYTDKDAWTEKFTQETIVTKNLTVYAYFKDAATLNLKFYVFNNLYHTDTMDGVSRVTLPAEPQIDGFRFDGWFLLNYSGEMTANQLTEDYFVENNSIQSKNVKAKMTQITKDNSATGTYEISKDGKYLYMGEYPTGYYKNASIKSTPNADGYYEDYSGNRYVKVESATFVKGYPGAINFFQDNDTLIKDGQTYYFRVEKIKWRILENDGDTALVMPTQVLFRHKFQDAKNKDENGGVDIRDYKNSDVRYYMNNVLINEIFTAEQRAVILTSWVDNSKDAIGWMGSESPWEDTFDKLFLLSRKDAQAMTGNTTTFQYKKLLVSDYQRATGLPVCTTSYNGGDSGYTNWWLRSRSSESTSGAAVVVCSPDGHFGQENVYSAEYGVVPIFRIDL